MKKYTSEEIATAIKIAAEMGAERSVNVMADMKTQLESRGALSDRQWDYLHNLVVQHTEDKLQEFRNYKQRFIEDESWRERITVISDYYLNNGGGYFSKTAFRAKVALAYGEFLPDDKLPDYNSMQRMLNNKYADKVWESHANPALYKAGDLVQIRSTGVNRIWGQRKHSQEKLAGIENLNSHPCLIIKADAKPISDALTYKPKQGGARVYTVMPVGSILMYDILECDLKKNRKTKAMK